MKICHQQAANLNDSDQNIEFKFGENNNVHQLSNAYLQYELTIERNVAVAANRVLVNGDAISLINNAFAYCFKDARLRKTGRSDIEHNKFVGQISTFMRALTNKDVDLLSHFDKIVEPEDEIEKTSFKHLLINNHDVAAIKGKNERELPLEHILGFCETFKKNTEHLGFHLTFKAADLQDII